MCVRAVVVVVVVVVVVCVCVCGGGCVGVCDNNSTCLVRDKVTTSFSEHMLSVCIISCQSDSCFYLFRWDVTGMLDGALNIE